MDQTAFGDFYRRTSRSLWSYVYRVTGNAADAEDIVQEAFCRLLRGGPDADEEQRRRYLFRIASNLVVDRWRRQKREHDVVRQHFSVAVASESSEHEEEVARTFARLTRSERALLWLAYVEGQSHNDIAVSLGLSRRSVKVLLFRARRRLRDLMESVGTVTRV
jgi:RNA polymerase sigma-70 factor (ECF subfamily)